MAPQPSAPPPKVATVLGAIGTLFVTLMIDSMVIKANSFLLVVGAFRIYKNWRRHSTEGVPGWMVFSWAVAMVPFGAYCTIQNLNIAIKVQPQLFCSLCLACWGQTLYYANKYKPWQALLTILGTGVSFASIQLLLVFTLRIPYSQGISWPITILGIVGAILINLGLVAPFIDASKRDWRIIGVSFRFLSIDFAGAVFSLLSLCFQETLDRYAAGSYICVIVLETGICAVQVSWIIRKWGPIREARKEGKTYDEFVGDGKREGTVAVVTENNKDDNVISSDVGPRDWRRILTISGFFAKMNQRHGEAKSIHDAEKGNASAEEDTDSSSNSSEESLPQQQQPPPPLQIPTPIHPPAYSPRKISKPELGFQDPNSHP